jgi:flagellar hook assembly protein FlgD
MAMQGNEVYLATAAGVAAFPAQCIAASAVGDEARLPGTASMIAYPNPASSGAVIHFSAGHSRVPGDVRIYDVAGRQVRAFATNAASPEMDFTWDGRDDLGRTAGAGVYLVRAHTGAGDFATRVVILR